MRVLAVFGLAVIACAQQNPALQCVANVGATPTVRAEGLSERVGDLVFNCTGGTPLPLGAVVPTTNFTVVYNTPLTNAHTPDGASDALLLIDEPNATATSSPIRFAPAPIFSPPPPIIHTGNGTPNVFQGLVRGNEVVFNGVPILAPATNGTRVYRVTNTRVNAHSLGTSSTFTPSQIVAKIQATDLGSITFNNPNQTVAFVQPSLMTDVTRTFTRQHCLPINFPFMGMPDLTNVTTLVFSPLFPTAFKTRSTAQGTDANPFPPPSVQNVPGQNLSLSELGFTIPGIDSQVSTGTRFEANFFNVSNMLDVWVQRRSVTSDNQVAILRDTPEFGVTRVMGNYANLQVTSGSARAVWEVINTKPNAAAFTFDVFASYTSDGTIQNSPPPGNVTVLLGYSAVTSTAEPITPVGSTSSVLPRSLDLPSFYNGVNLLNTQFDRFAAFSLTPCNVNPGIGGVIPPGSTASRVGFFGAPNEDPVASENFIFTSLRNPVTSGLSATPAATNTQVPAASLEGGERGVTSNWLTVTTSSTSLPQTAKISVNPAGLSPGKYTGSIAFTASGIGTINLPVDFTVSGQLPFFRPAGVTSAGSYASGIVTPGEAIVIFGTRFGPPALAGLDFSNGQVSTVVGETRVLFDGVPAPMIYAVNGQVSAFVPYAVAANPRTSIQVEYKGVKSNPVIVPVLKAVPALLTSDSSGFGQAAALNQDTSVNLPAKPESVGNQVVLFGSGGGQTTPVGRDGRLNGVGGILPVFNLGPISVTIGGRPAVIAYAGPAPGAVEGVFQVNVTIPPGTPSGPASVVVFFGDYVTQPGVTISVK